MHIFNRTTLTAAFFSLTLTFLTNQTARAQTQDLVSEDKFDAAFIVISPVGAVASHEASNLSFEQTTASLNSNFRLFFSNLTLTTALQQVTSNSYNLDFLLTTGSNAGFIPPEIGLGGQAINEWRVDIGNFISGINNGIDFLTPVTYNSAQGSWFDDGNLVLETSYLSQLNDSSTTTQFLGQFEVRLNTGDLGAFGNGIDTFALKVNVTTTNQPTQEVPEPSISGVLLISATLGLALARRRKGNKSFS
ncbi:PEP-CTERM sorting domain-containing protein [Nostoc sp. WHI]|uniref:PEP-CTERM sorting domain-containing protein n=1 Tax=Nostoc sp. WHI TaxID=2650611 RepID=UPI0018C541BA|nr:PEP-CTERM sorting domain-containing protein [Nostoc sp. WHI]MBG1269886.1 PEP-CTERM sorting domain-containing protein [Nostoc sp. WHI]